MSSGEETGDGKRKQATSRLSFLLVIFGSGRQHGREAEAGRKKELPRRLGLKVVWIILRSDPLRI